MERIHTTYHTPPTTTKTHSVQKDKIKPYIQHLRYPYTSENTGIQLTPVDKLGQDQTSLSPSVTSILQYFISELNHSAHTEPCMDISSTFLKLPDPRFRPLNSTVDPQHIPIVQQRTSSPTPMFSHGHYVTQNKSASPSMQVNTRRLCPRGSHISQHTIKRT